MGSEPDGRTQATGTDDTEQDGAVGGHGTVTARRCRGSLLPVGIVLLAVFGAYGTSGADTGRIGPTSWWRASPPSGRTVDVAVLVGSDGCEELRPAPRPDEPPLR